MLDVAAFRNVSKMKPMRAKAARISIRIESGPGMELKEIVRNEAIMKLNEKSIFINDCIIGSDQEKSY